MSDALRGAVLLLAVCCMAAPACAASAGGRLVDAAHRGDAPAVASLLQDHAPVNAAAPDGATALAWAAANSDLAMADRLLKAGANPNLANDYGVTPLILAVQLKNDALVKRLLEAHAKPNQPLWTGETPLMFAARTGSVPAMAFLVAHGADVNLRESRHGQTALMWAAAAGQADAVRFLTARHADVAVATPVVHVMTTSAGAPQGIKTPIPADKGGLTAIMFAAQSSDSNPETIDALVDARADVNQAAADGTTPLLFALYRHVRPQDHFPHDTETVGDLGVAQALLAHGADPNKADLHGLTPLAAVVFTARGSELIGQNGSNDEFILHPHDADAQAQMKLLLDHGADPNLRIADYYPPEPAGADLRYPSRYMNVSPFLLAAAFEKPALVEMMQASGRLNINTPRDNGNTPLMDAVEVDSPIAVEALIDAGADVNAVNPATGRTALHLAATGPSGAGRIVHDLADHGARLDARDKAGKTPLDLAREAGPRPRGGNRAPPPPAGTAQILARGRPIPAGNSGQTEMLALAGPAKADLSAPPSKTASAGAGGP